MYIYSICIRTYCGYGNEAEIGGLQRVPVLPDAEQQSSYEDVAACEDEEEADALL